MHIAAVGKSWIIFCVFAAVQIPSIPVQAQTLAPCSGLTRLEFQSCMEAFQLLTEDTDSFAGNAVMLTSEEDVWSVRYDRIPRPQEEGSETLCATLENVLVLAEGQPIRLLYTSRDRVRDLKIPSLGFEGTAVPGRVNEFDIDGGILKPFAAGETATSSESIQVRILSTQEFDAWAQTTITEKCSATR